jgi:hypothetical protein
MKKPACASRERASVPFVSGRESKVPLTSLDHLIEA